MNTPRSKSRTGWLIGAAAGICVAASHAVAGPAAPTVGENDPWALFGSFPPGVDAAAVLNAPGQRLFQDPGGRAVRAALARTGMFSQTVRAWTGLANALGYTEDEAATALLGRRVIVAWDRLITPAGGAAGALATVARFDTRWAVIAEVNHDTARAIRASLKAAPRRTVGGRVIYTIDAGRIAMAVTDDAEHTRVLIAPVEAASLLDALLTALRTPTEPAGPGLTGAAPENPDPTPDLGAAARSVLGEVEPGWSAVAAFRLPGSDRPTALELRTNSGAWGLRFASDLQLTGPDDQQAGAPVGVLAAAGGDALFAAAFSGGPALSEGAIDLRLSARTIGSEPAEPQDTRTDPLVHDRGSVIVLHTADAGPNADTAPHHRARTAVLQVITHAASDAPFAERIDRLISTAIGGDNPPSHRGLFPDAVRSHTMPATMMTGDPDAQTGDGLWPGRGARVAWSIAPDAADRAGVVSIAIGTASVDPSGLARKGREAWERGADDFDPSVITAGRARPAALAGLLGTDTAGPLLNLARAVDRIEWTVRRTNNLTRGEVLLRLTDPAATLGAP